MWILRAVLGAVGVIALIAAAIAMLAGAALFAILWLFAIGLVLTVGVLFERTHYKLLSPKAPGSDWDATSERFFDPTSGRMVRVYTKPITGERWYVDEGSAKD
ncbi:MAG: hypothetical protein ACREV7_21475 [Steroidobacteraceae bacterium]